MDKSIGKKRWAIAEGWIPPSGLDGSRELRSHETACILNAGNQIATVVVTLFFADREPVEHILTIRPRRSYHLQFNDLPGIPFATDFSSLFESDVPIVVQHTRLDSRLPEISLLSTTAYSE